MKVRVIQRNEKTALVEWQENEGLRRGYVPAKVVEGDGVVASELSSAIPYGEDWAAAIEPRVSAEAIADSLRAHGIWTFDDARANPQGVLAALQAAYAVDVAAIMRAAKTSKEK